MAPGDYGTKAVPTYVAAEAETTPLPKITVPLAPPAPPGGRKGLGDLPMRVIYRIIAGAAAVVGVGTVATIVVLGKTGSEPPHAAAAKPAHSPLMATATPTLSPSPTPTPTPTPTIPAVLAAAFADSRLQELPDTEKKLGRLPGKPAPRHGVLKDRRSGVSVPKFTKVWRPVKTKAFGSRQDLPQVKGSPVRGMVISCPLPVAAQDDMRDTALLAARWTLKYQPKGTTLTWTAMDDLTIGKRDAVVLGFNAHYKVKGKKRTSSAAVVVIDVPNKKPALVYAVIPDTQKKAWRDINSVVSGIKVP
ncbi:hypothetical protein [Planotetraspora mira]|uniref:Fibronectin attachment protein n=1 Tax=Planotetraspora mira TaxID=58121 RepID=A0A8J3X8P2_9ACTN|nr:hypothetical protein [Planotetraspora mira]GII27723.1 hypothetical protein Pmi06nite_11650 [Planotetraspora mira]